MTVRTRPELGELKAGQKVMVRRSMNGMRGRKPEERYIPAVVVKAARIWIDIEAEAGHVHRRWRMRRNTQNEGTQWSGSNDSFATLDQHQWDETQAWACGVLSENGIRLDQASRWRGREIELADLLSKGEDR